MRNSVMPVILVVVMVVAVVLAMRTESKPGLNGPDLHPGIFRLPKKDKFHVDSATLTSTNQVKQDGVSPANRGESWRVVLVMAKDRHPLTRSTVLAIGESLTGHGTITIFAPVDAPVFPLGISRVIAVTTQDAQIPPTLGGEAKATLRVSSQLAGLPLGHPAAPLLPNAEGTTGTVLTITHHTAAQTNVAGWPNWWAALGRGVAGTVLDTLAPGGPAAVVDATVETERRKWLPTLVPLADWGSALTQPPTTERLRWDFAFQEPLVRGWVGHVTGLTAPDRSGVEKPTLDQLLERMNVGKWEEAAMTTTASSGVRVFSRKATPEALTEWFSITSVENGWTVAWWQERSGAPALIADWAKAAASGDQSAARLLHAHRDCPVLPAELRDAARTALDGVKK